MKKIVLIDDDPLIHRMVQTALGREFEMVGCSTIAEAHKLFDSDNGFAAVLIDRNLPDGDGLEICTRIRTELGIQTLPIIFLSGAGSEGDKVSGFYSGADDYVTKPFGMLELKARLEARLRHLSPILSVGKLEVDLGSHRAYVKDERGRNEISLTRLEFKMLIVFLQALDRVFSREDLLARVWGQDLNVNDRVVDTHVSHLRRKLAASGLSLESLRGEGYRLKAAA